MTMSDDLDWKRWFKLKGQAPIVRREFSAEEMYQAFKARLIDEQQHPQVQGEPDGDVPSGLRSSPNMVRFTNFAFLDESRECGIYSDDGRLLAKAILDEKVHAALLSTVDVCTLVAPAQPDNVRQDDGS